MPTARFRTRGHPHALAVVERAIGDGTPPHALLLVGPARVGKTTLALDLAAGLVCHAVDAQARPCRACAGCAKLDHGNHPDVYRVTPGGAGGQIRLGQIQELISALALLPMEAQVRIAVVEGAHRMNPDTQNALLKTLEEPLGRVCLILAADDAASLLPTVISRVARLRLGPVGIAAIVELLGDVAAVDAARATAIARLAGGRPGLALSLARDPEAVLAHARIGRSLLDLLAADRRTRLAAVPDLLDAASQLQGTAVGDADSGASEDRPSAPPAERRTRSARSSRPAPAERRRAVIQLLSVWEALARDLAVAAAGGHREVRDVELLDELVERSATIDRSSIARFLSRIDALATAVDMYANPELALDVLLLEWPELRAA